MHIHSYAMKHFWNNIGNAWMTRILPRQFLHVVKQEVKVGATNSYKMKQNAVMRILAVAQEDLGEVVHNVPPWTGQLGWLSQDGRLQASNSISKKSTPNQSHSYNIHIDWNGNDRAQHISAFRSKYRNCIFLLVMLLVFSQPYYYVSCLSKTDAA